MIVGDEIRRNKRMRVGYERKSGTENLGGKNETI